MKSLLNESGQTLSYLALWYRGQYYSKARGDLDPTGELKKQVLSHKLNEINVHLKRFGIPPVKLNP